MVRFKQRYITVEINPTEGSNKPFLIQDYDIHEAILKAIESIHGVDGLGLVTSRMKTKYCNNLTRIAIIKVAHGPHQIVTSSIPFINEIKKRSVTLRTLYIGGTLRHCYKRIMRHHREQMVKMLRYIKSKEDRDDLEKQLFDFTEVLNFDAGLTASQGAQRTLPANTSLDEP